MDQVILVYVPINTSEQARTLAQHLLESRLVACVNIIPGVHSMYVWNDALADDHEVVMVIKTLEHKYVDLQKAIISHHPYELPCIIKMNVETTSSFLQFISSVVK